MFTNTIKSFITASLLLAGIVTQAQGGVDETPAKGQIEQVSNHQPYQFNATSRVYKASASDMASSWEASGWVVSGAVMSTGLYGSNDQKSITSEAITIPAVEEGEAVVLSIKEFFSLETSYDFGAVKVSTDNGATWSTIGTRSGKSGIREKEYIITKYAGKAVTLSLELSSDESFESKGWDVYSVAIAVGQLNFGANTVALKSSLKAGAEELNVKSVHDDNFPEFVYVDFEYLVDGNFNNTLSIADLNLEENGIAQNGCLRLWGPSQTTTKKPVDVVVIMDNSGSLDNEQAAVIAGIENLVDGLESFNYDANFALVRFGAYSSAPYVEYENAITDVTSYWETDGGNFKTMLQRNVTSGGTERGYDAILGAAQHVVSSSRPIADVVFIFVTDEDVTQGSNLGTISKADAIAECLATGSRVMSIVPDQAKYNASYNDVATQTNGESFILEEGNNERITALFSDVILPKIALSVG